MNIISKQPDVFTTNDEIISVTPEIIADIKQAAYVSPRGRARFCAHPDNRHPVQEMLIALCQNTYLRPHRHPGKSESFHVIEGKADVVIFEDSGNIMQIIRLDTYEHAGTFYYRISTPLFHTLIIQTDCLVVHETTNGPFTPGDCVFADWAPMEYDRHAAANFQNDLRKKLRACNSNKKQP